MPARAHNSNIVLFPLCDKSGVMLQALEPAVLEGADSRARRPGTRPDAVVFAWLLDLPAEMDSADAARAVLDVTRHHVSLLTPYQRSVVYELSKLVKREDSDWDRFSEDLPAKRFRTPRRGRGFFSRTSRQIERTQPV